MTAMKLEWMLVAAGLWCGVAAHAQEDVAPAGAEHAEADQLTPAPAASTQGQAPADESPPAPSSEPQTSDAPLPTVPVAELRPQEPPVDPLAEDGPTELDEITVTANKRKELARTVPMAISVLTGDQLDRIGASQFADFAAYIPGLNFSSIGPGLNTMAMRGVTTGQEASATVATYLDELPLGSSTSYALGSIGQDFNVFDLDRVEALKGPQGTLYGASTLGGLLKYVTQAPEPYHWQGQVQVEGAEPARGGRNTAIRGVLNVPLFDLPAAIRIVGVGLDDGGFIDNPDRSLTNVNAGTVRGGRISLGGEFMPALNFRLTAIDQKIHRDGYTTTGRDRETHAPVQGTYDQQYVLDQPFEQNIRVYAATVNWDIGWASFASVSGYQDLSQMLLIDVTRSVGATVGTGTLLPLLSEAPTTVRKFSQELRLASAASSTLEWVGGLLYVRERSVLGVNVLAPDTPDGTIAGIYIFDGEIPSTYREFAGFGQATYHFTERVDVTLGLRQSRDWQHYEQHFRGYLNQPTNPTATTVDKADTSDSVRTYMASPRWQISDDWLAYGRVASGYRPGGPNFIIKDALGRPNAPPSFEPDTVWNYEVGTKYSFLGGSAYIEAALYRVDWSNIQLLFNSGGGNNIQNGGQAQVDGAEVATLWRTPWSLTVAGSASWINARLTEDSPNIEARADAPLPYSPRFSGALTLDYNFALPGFNGLLLGTIGASNSWQGRRAAGFEGSTIRPQYWLDSYHQLDLRAGLVAQWANPVRLQFFVKNLGNEPAEIYADSVAAGRDPSAPVNVGIIPPRMVGLQVTMEFAR